MQRSKMKKDDNGHVVVETVCAFIPFVLLIVSILSLVNIVTLQARVHNAITQAAKALSVYSYLLEVTGVANELTTLDNKANRVAQSANELRDDFNSALDGIESLANLRNTAERVYGWGEEAAGNPQQMVQQLLSFGQNELRNQAFEVMVRPLVGRYLLNGDMTGDEYLRSVRVVNRHTGNAGLEALEFYRFSNLGLGNSVLIDRNGNVKLTVEYEVEYTFGALPLPFSPTLRITQTAVTKAWLNGSGEGYW